MGEYAEMQIFAQMRGMNACDLSVQEIVEFYAEYDADQPKKPAKHNSFRCKCGRRLRSYRALSDHQRDKHGIKPGASG